MSVWRHCLTWALLATICLPSPAADKVGRVVGLCVRSRQEPVSGARFLVGGLLPVEAARTTAAGNVALGHRALVSKATLDSLGAAQAWLAGDPVTGPLLTEAGALLRFEAQELALDGSSAGLAMALAVDSALRGLPLLQSVAVTGGLLPDGRVTPVVGVGYKVSAVFAEGLDTVLLPAANAAALLAAAPPEVFCRARVVGVHGIDTARFELAGPAGPRGESYTRYLATFQEGLRLVAVGQLTAAAAALERCTAAHPEDLTAARWLRQAIDWARARQQPSALWQAAALRQARAYDDLVATGQLLTRHAARLAGGEQQALELVLAEAGRRRDSLLADQLYQLAARAALAADWATCRSALRDFRALRQRAPDDWHDFEALDSRLGDWPAEGGAAPAAAWRDVSIVAEARGRWDEALAAVDRALELGCDPADLAARRVALLLRLGRRSEAVPVGLAALWQDPANNRLRAGLAAGGLDLDPPQPVVSIDEGQRLGGEHWLVIASEANARIEARLDGQPVLAAVTRGTARWQLPPPDLPRLLTVTAMDPAGNTGLTARLLPVDPVPALPSWQPSREPGRQTVAVTVPGVWLVAGGDAVDLWPELLLGLAVKAARCAATAVRCGAEGLALLPGPADQPLRWTAPTGPGQVIETRFWGQTADGRGLGPVPLTLVVNPNRLAAITSPAEGMRLPAGASVPITVASVPGFRPVAARLVVDGRPEAAWQHPGKIVWETAGLADGPHSLAVTLHEPGPRSCQTAAITVTLGP